MTECGHLPPKAYHCVQCLLDKIKSYQEAMWDLQEMYSELEGERNKLNGELHKHKARHCAMDDCKCQPVFCAKCTDAQSENEVATAYDRAAQTVQECGCRCKPNRRKCDLCDAAAGVLLLKDEQCNS